MPVSSMKAIPYSDPGMLQGGVREHRAILNNLQADAFRSASQSQDTAQAARAFSGSDVTNAQTQTASLSQTATANNTKTVTIGAVEGTNASSAGFNFNYLQKYIAGADANDWLARGAANIAQDQGGDQSGFAKLEDFTGTDSDAANSLTQNGQVTQLFDVDLTATLSNTTNGGNVGQVLNAFAFVALEASVPMEGLTVRSTSKSMSEIERLAPALSRTLMPDSGSSSFSARLTLRASDVNSPIST